MEQIDPNEYTPFTLEEMRESERRYQEKHRKPVPIGELVTLTKDDEVRYMAVPEAPAPITFEQGRNLLHNCMRNARMRHGWKYTFTDEQKVIVNDLIRYFIADPECTLDLDKGIYLYGDVGRGKTELMKIFAAFVLGTSMQFTVVSTRGIVFDLAKEKDVGMLSRYFSTHICFDDFGFEPVQSNIWGNEVRVMELIIDERDRHYQMTHATSNIPPDKLDRIYDRRTVSRIHKRFNFVMYDGVDHRRNG